MATMAHDDESLQSSEGYDNDSAHSEHLNFPEGSREWGLAKMWLTGHLKAPNRDEHLDMRDQGLQLAELSELCGELAADEDLKSLDLSGNAIGTVWDTADNSAPLRPADGHQYEPLPLAEVVAAALRANQALTHVDLSRNGLGDYGQASLMALLTALEDKATLAILDLSANGLLGPDGMRYTALSHLTKVVLPSVGRTMMHLTLAFNELHSEAAKFIAGAVTMEASPCLLSLDLGCNRLAEDPRGEHDGTGVKALAASLQGHTSCTALNLRDNRLGNGECSVIAAAASAMVSLASLDLSENLMTASGAAALQEHLWCDEHLLHLNLNGCPLDGGKGTAGAAFGGGGLKALATMLSKNHCLTALELAGTGFGDKDAIAFERAMRSNTTLVRLEIFANEASGLGPAKANKLFEAVNANSELLAVADDPTGYNYSHQHRVMRRHLVHKVHHLPPRTHHQLLTQNPSFGGDVHGSMRRRLLELAPPGRRDLLETSTKRKPGPAHPSTMPPGAMPPVRGALPSEAHGGSIGGSLAIMTSTSGLTAREDGSVASPGSLPAL